MLVQAIAIMTAIGQWLVMAKGLEVDDEDARNLVSYFRFDIKPMAK